MDKKKHDSHQHEKKGESAPQDKVELAQPVSDADRIKELEEALAAKGLESASNWDKYLRERADLENYRKRVQKEKEEILKYGNEQIIFEILPSLDNLERAIDHANEESPIVEGVKLTLSLLVSTLKKFGVTPVDTPAGTPFNPEFHQAMGQVESADQEPNSIVSVFQKGYMLNDRLLRPAMVTVAVKPQA